MSIVSIIPARAGSKGIPGKNMYSVEGKPLIQWTFEKVLDSKLLTHNFVSTNDSKVVDLVKDFPIETIIRPDAISTDTSTSEEALLHALNLIEKNFSITPDVIVFLQATSPLRLSDDIDNAINFFFENNLDSLFSSTELSDLTLWSLNRCNELESLNFDYNNRLRRQDQNSNFIENGSIYIFKPSVILENNNRLGGKIGMFKMNFWQTWELDTLEDLDVIEYYIREKMINE